MKSSTYSQTTLNRVCHLHELFIQGQIPGPEKHEVNPGLPVNSRENYLYFTLAASLNFQRNSPALWASALQTFESTETNYVFFPEKVANVDFPTLQQDLLRYKLALQTNRHPKAWQQICSSLMLHYDSNPKNVLEEGYFDVPTIIKNLQVTNKTLFPFLCGSKLSNYWLFILLEFTDVKLQNVEALSIIPDTHVIKSSAKLGLTREGALAHEVDAVWREVLVELKISPVEMHSALWRWSRSGFEQPV